MQSRKRAALIFGGSFILFFILFGVTAPKTDTSNNESQATKTPSTTTKPVAAPSNNPVPANPKLSKQAAQKDLDEIMGLAKKAGLVISYEFSNSASVVYSGNTWYSQTVAFKKDFMAKIAIDKEAITGYRHFEVRDAYSNEKVAEVTAFSGSLKVYK